MNRGNILLLIDETERPNAESALWSAGYTVFTSQNIEEAAELIRREPIDLMIVSVDRTTKERVAFLTTAKWRLSEVARILILAPGDKSFIKKAHEADIGHICLLSPVEGQVLVDTVAELLAWAKPELAESGNLQTNRPPQRGAPASVKQPTDNHSSAEQRLRWYR